MEWFALALFRVYEATGDNDYLTMSTNLWDDIKTGENSNQGGGIAWRKPQPDYKNTPANAPAIIYACRRHQRFGHSWELDLATNLYNWLKGTLVTSSGRVQDGINRLGNGQIDDWQFTYNYGTFVGAALEMYQSTGNASYLSDAIRSADYAIQRAGLLNNAVFKDEGGGDGALFKGVLVRYLALLAKEPAVASAKRNYYKAILEDQAQSVHANAYNRSHRTIGNSWTARAGASVDMSAQLSGIMMLEVAADLRLALPDNIASPLEDGATYVIRFVHSNKAMDFDTNNGSNVHQWQYLNQSNQKWVLNSTGSGYYELRPENSGKILRANGTTSGSNAYVDSDNNYRSQRWKIIAVGGGLYSLQNQYSGLYLDGTGSTANGTNVQVWPSNGSNAQKLTFNKASSARTTATRVKTSLPATERSEVTLYPNPVSSGKPLTIGLSRRGNTAEGVVYNMRGQEVSRFSASSGRTTISTNGLGRGMYVVKIIEDGTLEAKKVFCRVAYLNSYQNHFGTLV